MQNICSRCQGANADAGQLPARIADVSVRWDKNALTMFNGSEKIKNKNFNPASQRIVRWETEFLKEAFGSQPETCNKSIVFKI